MAQPQRLDFAELTTGMRFLAPDKVITVRRTAEKWPFFHSCTNQLDMPRYGSRAALQASLSEALANGQAGGFSEFAHIGAGAPTAPSDGSGSSGGSGSDDGGLTAAERREEVMGGLGLSAPPVSSSSRAATLLGLFGSGSGLGGLFGPGGDGLFGPGGSGGPSSDPGGSAGLASRLLEALAAAGGDPSESPHLAAMLQEAMQSGGGGGAAAQLAEEMRGSGGGSEGVEEGEGEEGEGEEDDEEEYDEDGNPVGEDYGDGEEDEDAEGYDDCDEDGGEGGDDGEGAEGSCSSGGGAMDETANLN